MRFVTGFAVAGLLSSCATLHEADQGISAYSGQGEARYESERLSAQADKDSGSFSVSCSRDQRVYRRGETQVTFGDCSRFGYPPELVRTKVISNEESILMIMNSSLGVVGEGTLILDDETRMLPIAIDNLESFGDVLARDRIVIHGGTIDASACGMTLWSKELTLDWERGRIVRERTLPRAQPRC